MNHVTQILATGTTQPLKRSKTEDVYHAVRRGILLSQFRPDDAIPEQQVAQALGCSQGTVREALLRLEQDGLVNRRGYHGTIVSRTSFDEAVHMAKIRLALETESARRSAERMGEKDFARLDEIIAQIEAAEVARDGYALSELDRAFHLVVFRAANLATLEPILTRCALHIHRYTFGHGEEWKDPGNRVGLPASSIQHGELRDALATRAGDTAAQAMREHIETILDYWSPELMRAVNAG